jgi:hypothetical protein
MQCVCIGSNVVLRRESESGNMDHWIMDSTEALSLLENDNLRLAVCQCRQNDAEARNQKIAQLQEQLRSSQQEVGRPRR